MTDDILDINKNGELLKAPPAKRMTAGLLDDYYINCYLDNPSSKFGALKQAAINAGIETEQTRQHAHTIHRRLQHHIDKGLMKRMMEGAVLGYSVLYQMAASDLTNESNRLKAAALLIEYAGKNKPQQITDNNRSRKDILEEIEQARLRIEQATGTKLDKI